MDYFICCSLGFLIASFFMRGAGAMDCPTQMVLYGKHCYKVLSHKLSWMEAEKACQDYVPGAHLASIRTYAEVEEISVYILDYHNDFENVWIGLYRTGKSKSTSPKRTKWLWSDGSSYGYNYWDEGEPNQAKSRENCVELLHDSGYIFWNDEDCDAKRRFLCKYKH